MYRSYGPLPLRAARVLLRDNASAVLRGYANGNRLAASGPYHYAIIDLCDMWATIHAYDPDWALEAEFGCDEEA